jgi:hypothetical protein
LNLPIFSRSGRSRYKKYSRTEKISQVSKVAKAIRFLPVPGSRRHFLFRNAAGFGECLSHFEESAAPTLR